MNHTPNKLSFRLTRFNQPGLSALCYRLGTYATFVQQMLARLLAQTGPGSVQPNGKPPLAGLNRNAHQDWAVALLYAWAVVADVLAFYQERIANEGYLRTATEPRSVLELIRAIGYEPRPGVAASTYLAFTVLAEADKPPRRVLVPKGLAVQSVPSQSHRPQVPQDLVAHRPPRPAQLPQTFETSQDFEARSEWSVLKPARFLPMGWQDIRPGTTSLRLAGIKTGLRPGDAILVVGKGAGDEENKSQPWLFAILNAVEMKPQAGFTQVAWENGQRSEMGQRPLRNPKVFALRQQTTLLGYTQTGLYYALDQTARWAPTNIGLPDEAVRALVMTKNGRLFAGTKKGVFHSENHGQSWQPANTGLTKKPIYALAVSDAGSLYAGTDGGGIYRSTDQGQSWTAISSGRSTPNPRGLSRLWRRTSPALPQTVIRELMMVSCKHKHYLVAGTDDGVFRSTDRGKRWLPHNLDLPQTDPKTGLARVGVSALATLQQGRHLFAGTEQGVFRLKASLKLKLWVAVVSGLALGVVLFLLPTLTGSISNALVSGLMARYAQAFNSITTTMSPSLLLLALAVLSVLLLRRLLIRYLDILAQLGLPTQALVGHESGRLLAGTNYGIFRSETGGRLWRLIKRWRPVRGWQPVNQGLLTQLGVLEPTFQSTLDDRTISVALRQAMANYKIILTQDNFLIVESSGSRWLIVDKNETPLYVLRKVAEGIAVYRGRSIQTLAISPQGDLLAGTAKGEVFCSTDNGDHWVALTGNLRLKDIQALLATQKGTFAAGTPLKETAEGQWSRFQVQNQQVDLPKTFPKISAGSWLVLRQNQKPAIALYRTEEVVTATSQDFKKKSAFTRLVVDTADDLGSFDRLTTTVLAQSEQLALFDDKPLAGNSLTLANLVPGLAAGHRIIVSGKRPRARVAGSAGNELALTSADGLQRAKLNPGDLLQVMAPLEPQASARTHWYLQNRDGFDGFVTVAADQIILEPANPDDESVSELAVILAVDNREQTRITLQESLQNIYDRATVTIYANVVHATHGQTIAAEVLGSSEGSQANYRFGLKQGSLTYLAGSTAPGLESTLTVTVNGLRWHEKPSLYGVNGDERVFSTRRDDRDRTVVIFGDGRHGARLPSGIDHVAATYRTGSGPEGNVEAGSLSQLQARPPGIRKVTNPIPARGGLAPETPDQARIKAPLEVRLVQRIVSLNDYEDFASAFAGIGRAQAKLLWNGRNRALHLTIADAAGQEVARNSDLYQALVRAINTARAAPMPPLHLDSFERLVFNLKATLVIEPVSKTYPG